MESDSPFDNPTLISAPREKLPVERKRDEEDVQIISPPPPKKPRKNAKKIVEIKDEDDDAKRHWLDSEVETLIALKGEMQPEFVKNAKKQGMYLMSFRFRSNLICFTHVSLRCLFFDPHLTTHQSTHDKSKIV